jgi:hypothetical protein
MFTQNLGHVQNIHTDRKHKLGFAIWKKNAIWYDINDPIFFHNLLFFLIKILQLHNLNLQKQMIRKMSKNTHVLKKSIYKSSLQSLPS